MKRIALTHHVGTLSNDSDAGSDESLGFRLGDLVLGGTGQGDIRLLDEQPRTLAWTEIHETNRIVMINLRIYSPSCHSKP